MNFFESIQSCISKYITFDGRANRSEFWYFSLFFAIVSASPTLIQILLNSHSSIFYQSYLVLIAGLIIPQAAVFVRRLHDVNKSGFWYPAYMSAILFGNDKFRSFIGIRFDDNLLPIYFLLIAICLSVIMYVLALLITKGDTLENNYGIPCYDDFKKSKPTPSPESIDNYELLIRLNKLYNQGLITEGQFKVRESILLKSKKKP